MLQMTRQQYQQKYGGTSPSTAPVTNAPITMTRQQYAQKYGVQPGEKRTLGGFLGNVAKSGANLVKDTVSAAVNVFNPDLEKNTVANIGRLTTGIVGHLDPTKGNQIVDRVPGLGMIQKKFGNQEDRATAVFDFYKDRYGGVENIKNSLYTDPVGVVADVGTVLTGVGGALKGGGMAASKLGSVERASQLASAGSKLSELGAAVDPIVATTKAGGGVTSRIFSRVKPVVSASKNADDIVRLQKIAKAEGVELPVSAMTDNQFVRQGETLAGKGLFGRKISGRFEQASELPNKILSKVTNENVGDIAATKNALGQSVKNELNTFSRGFRDKASAIYDDIATKLGDKKVVPTNTQQVISDLYDQQRMSALPQGAGQKLLEGLFYNLENTDTYAKLNQTRKDIGQLMKSTDPVASGQQAQLKAIYGAIQKDLDAVAQTSRDAKKTLVLKKSMDDKWKEFTTMINRQEGRQVLSTTTDIEDIVPRIYKPNNVSSIERLKKFVTPQTFKELGDTLLTDIVNNSVGRDGLIDPNKWRTNMNKWDRPTLLAAIGEDGVTKLDNITRTVEDASFAKKQLSDSTKSYYGSQTAMLANTGLGGGSVTASIMTLNPVPVLSYLGVNALGSALFGSDFGRNLITDGVKTPKLFSRTSGAAGKVYQTGRYGRMTNAGTEK